MDGTDMGDVREMFRKGMESARERREVEVKVTSEETLGVAAGKLSEMLRDVFHLPEEDVEALVVHESSHARRYLDRAKLRGLLANGSMGVNTRWGKLEGVSFGHPWEGLDYKPVSKCTLV